MCSPDKTRVCASFFKMRPLDVLQEAVLLLKAATNVAAGFIVETHLTELSACKGVTLSY